MTTLEVTAPSGRPTEPSAHNPRRPAYWKAYMLAPDWDAKHGVFEDNWSANSGFDGLLFTAQAALDLAVTSDVPAKHKVLFRTSESRARRLANTATDPDVVLSAELLLANLALHETIHALEEHPRIDAIERARLANVAVLDRFMEHGRFVRFGDALRYSRFKGIAAEVLSIGLLQRYAVREIGQPGWTPLTAPLSGNAIHFKRGEKNPSWDISVVTDGDGAAIDPTHKLQVKTDKRSSSLDKTYTCYADDIGLLHVQDDLQVDPDEKAHISVIIRDLVADSTCCSGVSRASHRTAVRAELAVAKLI